MKKRSVKKATVAAAEKEYVAPESVFHMEPLPATFTLVSIFGLIITTVFTVSGRVNLSWGVAFDLVFLLMFISSMLSISPRFSSD